MSDRMRSSLMRRNMKDLQRGLRLGLTVVTELWNYPTGDWVSSVHAADIDGDGDIEVLLGSRDCNVYILTKRGMQKSKLRPCEEWIRTIRGIHSAEEIDGMRIIVGARDGSVLAFDEMGEILWRYQACHVVRQVRTADIDRDGKIEVLVASEDQFIYVLSSETGELLWQYATAGWVNTVHVADVDGDGELEVLAGSGDKHLYILDHQGSLKCRHYVGSEILSIFAVDVDKDGQIEILVATDAKELCALTSDGREKWRFQADSRVLSLAIADLNNDGHREVIAASEDKHLYFLNKNGELIWRHNLNSRVFSVYAIDLDNDGQVEVLAGTEDSIHVLHVELMAGLCDKILTLYKKLEQPPITHLELSATEVALLYNLINERPPDEQPLTLASAKAYSAAGKYQQALAALVLLSQQKVHLLWRRKVGRVRAVFSGDLNDDGQLEIVAGTDEGGIYVFDALGEKVWSHPCDDRIWTVYVGDVDLDGALEVVAGSASGRLYVFSNRGEIKWEDTMHERVESVYINEDKAAGYAEMVIGLRGKQGRIQIYDHHFEAKIAPIITPHGIRVVCTHDLNEDGQAEVIAGGDDDNVYAYHRNGDVAWSYRTGDRARGLVLKDIDADGHMEIVVGSEDRNVHVLDNAGHLRWRYYTPHRVLSVNTLDLDLDGAIEVFLGTDDGNVLFLSKSGDPLWKYKVGDRVCGVQAADCNRDGKIEIIVGSEDGMLYLLQVLDLQEVFHEMEQCWHALQQEVGSEKLLYRLAGSPDPSLRSFALTRISSQSALAQQDLAALHELVRDTSSEVRYVFAQEMPRIYGVNPVQARRFMDVLLADQERDVRLALVDSLPAIAHIDETVGFQYLERFSRSVDAWVRRAVVRKLDQLAVSSPQRVFRLLLNLVYDEAEWVRQEVARALAHYFDLHEENLIKEARILITQDSDLPILKFAAYCATKAAVRSFFLVSTAMLEELNESNVLAKLENAVKAFEKTRMLKCGEEVWLIYHELYRLHRMMTIEEIAHYKCKVCETTLEDSNHFEPILKALRHLAAVAAVLAIYLKRERLGDRLASLLEATAAIEGVYADLDHMLMDAKGHKANFPERRVVETLLASWRTMVVAELGRLRGKADLKPELRTKSTRFEEQIGIWLDIRNDGRSPADNVRVTLRKTEDFEVIGERVQVFETVPTSDAVVAEFTIRPAAPSPHLTFELAYADAESKEKVLVFGDRLEIRQVEQQFVRVSNPYSVGTPIQTRDMFYGRKEDLAVLHEDLASVSTNMVVVLYGQRRSGKSSLLYQLLNSSSLEPHLPVYIDMQHETLNMSTARFLQHLAIAMYRNLKKIGIEIDQPEVKGFLEDPTLAFDLFLDDVEQVRGHRKLIIMIDEFEILEQKVNEGVLAREIFEYLRSLMQHRRGINFLLSGTHTIEQLAKGYWSVFFNIARHHRLSRLNAEAARQLITLPVKGRLEYDSLAIEKIRQLAADHPYFIQLICRSLVTHCNEMRKSYITINDVNTVQERVMETGQVHFKWLWEQTDLQGRLALSIVAQEGGDEGRSLSLKDIEEVYRNYGLLYKHEAVLHALENLIEGDILERVLDGTRFKVPTGLIRIWLRESKSLRRVMLEENLFQI